MSVTRVEVSALAGCPFKRVNKLFPPEMEYAMRVGQQRHREIEEVLRRLGYETEYQIVYRYAGIEVVGRADAVKHDPPIVAEIKSRNMGMSGLRQLLLYRDLLFLTRRREYRPVFILYEAGRARLEANFLWLPPVLTLWREAKKIVGWIASRGEWPRVRCDDCTTCTERGACRPALAWTPYRIEVLAPKTRKRRRRS